MFERSSTAVLAFGTGLMQRLNPTGSLLRARPFVARHDYIFTLLCLLNVNMGALNTSAFLEGSETGDRAAAADAENGEIREAPPELSLEMVLAQGLLDDMAGVFQQVRIDTYAFGMSLCWPGCDPRHWPLCTKHEGVSEERVGFRGLRHTPSLTAIK